MAREPKGKEHIITFPCKIPITLHVQLRKKDKLHHDGPDLT